VWFRGTVRLSRHIHVPAKTYFAQCLHHVSGRASQTSAVDRAGARDLSTDVSPQSTVFQRFRGEFSDRRQSRIHGRWAKRKLCLYIRKSSLVGEWATPSGYRPGTLLLAKFDERSDRSNLPLTSASHPPNLLNPEEPDSCWHYCAVSARGALKELSWTEPWGVLALHPSNLCKFTISMQSDCSLQLRPCRCSHFACLENRTSDLPTTLPKSPPHSQNLSLNQCLCHNFVVKVTEHGQK
jgi:hypothetical protein